MKFAAKRTWPEKASTWEHEAQAEDMESFALEFAMLEQLAPETEFAVMQREGGQGVRFFRVAATDPYRLEPAVHRQASVSAPAVGAESQAAVEPSSAKESGATDEPPAVPGLGPAISTIFYMGKVFVTATVIIAVLGVIMTYIRKAFT